MTLYNALVRRRATGPTAKLIEIIWPAILANECTRTLPESGIAAIAEFSFNTLSL